MRAFREERPKAPLFFETLEPRVLLSTDPAGIAPSSDLQPSPAEPAIIAEGSGVEGTQLTQESVSGAYYSSSGSLDVQLVQAPGSTVDPATMEWMPCVPTPEQTRMYVVADGTSTKVRVTLLFRDSDYAVRDWGIVQQEGNTFTVNAQVEGWAQPIPWTNPALSHDYDLGTLADGDYVFTFQASGQTVESREFRPGPEQWVPYAPTAEQTNISVVTDEAGTRVRVTITFPDAGYRIQDWGTPQLDRLLFRGFVANLDMEHWTGPSALVITQVSHDYDLGVLTSNGEYAFNLTDTPEFIKSRFFVISDALKPVYRFWSREFSRHFYTIDEAERDKLIQRYAEVWEYEGVAYRAFTGPEPDLSPVYRFWSATLRAHFYTMDESERAKLVENYSAVWTFEGVAFYAYRQPHEVLGTVSIYRFWSDTLKSHFFTMSEAERAKLLSLYPDAWTYEHVAWYVYGQ